MKILIFFSLLLFVFLPLNAFAGQYPEKPVKIVIGYSPGGGTDIVGRYIFSKIAEQSGKIIIIENIPGATGVIGTRKVASAEPDGYTLLVGHISPNSINPGDFLSPPAPPDWDLSPISRIAISPSLLLVNPATNIKSLDDFKRWIDKNPNIIYGSDGVGSLAHLQMVSLLGDKEKSSIHVPYKGGAPALQAMLSGDIPIMFSPLPVAYEYISLGKFAVIAQTGEKRSLLLSNIPTLVEQKMQNSANVLWWGLFSPVGVSDDIKEYWEKSLFEVLSRPEVIKWLTQHGYTPAFLSRLVFEEYVKEENKKWSSVIKTISSR